MDLLVIIKYNLLVQKICRIFLNVATSGSCEHCFCGRVYFVSKFTMSYIRIWPEKVLQKNTEASDFLLHEFILPILRISDFIYKYLYYILTFSQIICSSDQMEKSFMFEDEN